MTWGRRRGWGVGGKHARAFICVPLLEWGRRSLPHGISSARHSPLGRRLGNFVLATWLIWGSEAPKTLKVKKVRNIMKIHDFCDFADFCDFGILLGTQKVLFLDDFLSKCCSETCEIARRAAAYELCEAVRAGKGSTDGGTGFPPKTLPHAPRRPVRGWYACHSLDGSG